MKFDVRTLLVVTAFLTFLMPSAFAKIVVINSQNWRDVYAGLLYSRINGMNAYFLNTPNPEGLLRILPKGQDVILIQSNSPYVATLSSLLSTNGYRVTVKHISDGTIDLYNKNIRTVYVVESDEPVAAVVTAPLASANKAWVFIVDSKNLGRITPLLRGKNVILVGYFKRSIKSVLDKYKTDEIIEPSKFKLSLLVADRFLKQHPTTQVIVADGRYLEEEMFSGYSPLIIVGTNLLPKETMQWMLNKGIKTCVVIGTQLTYIGEQIRSQSNKRIAVFIKYGQALPGTPIYALTMFPLPQPQLKLEVSSVIYDPAAKKILVNFVNSGNVGLFELTNLRILDDGVEIAAMGDKSPYFIGSGESLVVSYDKYLPPEEVSKNLTVQFFTSYGESPDSLDMYLTNIGRFGPPLTKPLQVKSVNDNSKLNVTSVVYYTNYHRIGVTVENLAGIPTYFIVKLPEVKVQGVPTHLQSEIAFIDGKTKEVFIPVSLDPIDIQDNSQIKIIVDYGQKKNLFVKSLSTTLPLKTSGALNITGFFTSVTGLSVISGIAIVIIVIVILFKKKSSRKPVKRKKKKR